MIRTSIRTDETANLLEHADSSDQDELDVTPAGEVGGRSGAGGEDSSPSDAASGGPPLRDPAQAQSDRIRSRYIAQLLPATNIPDRP